MGRVNVMASGTRVIFSMLLGQSEPAGLLTLILQGFNGEGRGRRFRLKTDQNLLTLHPMYKNPVLRRTLLKGLVSPVLAAPWLTTAAFAEELMLTPSQTEGPFYPDKLPLDTDNDLIQINASLTTAVGTVTWLSGRILDRRGDPISGAVVEIWQADNNGAYLHSGSDNRDKRDASFQGFGRFLTGSKGEYLFRTIRPVVYPGRQAPHIHVAVKLAGQPKFTTQLYIQGFPGNARDFVFRSVPEAARKLVEVPFEPLANSKIGALAAKFDVVMGYTPQG
jgi:protocatechuate 3,4-dioxygenase beta subunit